MSVDYGDSHTGLAMCDEGEVLASPLCVINERNFDRCVEKVARAAKDNKARLIVVGNPINMNGTIGERSEKCSLFAEKLRAGTDLKVDMWDERGTTIMAHAMLDDADKHGKKRRETIDSAAAALILESYMAYRKNHTQDALSE